MSLIASVVAMFVFGLFGLYCVLAVGAIGWASLVWRWEATGIITIAVLSILGSCAFLLAIHFSPFAISIN